MDEGEPTPRAGPCIEEVVAVDEAEFRLLHELLSSTEYDYIDILLHEGDGIEVYLEAFAGLDCIRLISLHARGCGPAALEYLKAAADWPEVSRVVIEGGCIDLEIPSEPPFRVARALDKLGVESPLVPRAFRVKRV
ncbi:MAG: hypothetical protein F7C08_03905 [Desulfurococcales archaeon]|nr:hypothetical protein [Desulfurococcales archaeon]MCE4605658.1 hypothetical protein [Desulfurococcales archaeon]